MRNIQIFVDPEAQTNYDRHMLAQARLYWAPLIERIPRKIHDEHREYAWLVKESGMKESRIRDLFEALKLDPRR